MCLFCCWEDYFVIWTLSCLAYWLYCAFLKMKFLILPGTLVILCLSQNEISYEKINKSLLESSGNTWSLSSKKEWAPWKTTCTDKFYQITFIFHRQWFYPFNSFLSDCPDMENLFCDEETIFIHFYTPWKRQKTSGLFILCEGSELLDNVQ